MPEGTLAECRILVVEDEFMLADDLRNELERAGAVVLGPVPDFKGALALLAGQAHLDGAVLDINLGGETSYPVADELLRREVPFLFTTGYDRLAIPERYQHITRCQKPVRVAVVLDAIRRVIHG
jgi:CheY-like chemotaxis protein